VARALRMAFRLHFTRDSIFRVVVLTLSTASTNAIWISERCRPNSCCAGASLISVETWVVCWHVTMKFQLGPFHVPHTVVDALIKVIWISPLVGILNHRVYKFLSPFSARSYRKWQHNKKLAEIKYILKFCATLNFPTKELHLSLEYSYECLTYPFRESQLCTIIWS